MTQYELCAAVFLLALVSPTAGSAQGGPPLITDDPGTVPVRHWEVNVAFTAEHRPGEQQYETPLVDMNYGYRDRLQLKLEIPWVLAGRPAPVAAGPGNANLGVKWRFRDEDGQGPAISTYPQLLLNNPTTSARRGLAERGASFFLPLQIQKSLGAVSVNADAGYLFHGSGSDVWSWGVAVGREVTPRLEVLAEIHGDSARGDRDLVANVGARCRLAESRTLLLSIGRSIARLTDAAPALLAYAGIQFAF